MLCRRKWRREHAHQPLAQGARRCGAGEGRDDASQAVRKLWDFAARNSHNPQIIQSLFDTEDEAEKREAEEERARRRAVALKSANIVADAYERAGIEPSEWTKNASYAEMREYALMERLRERGLDG